jgi:uncharacterized protein YbaR (Trm112 family)
MTVQCPDCKGISYYKKGFTRNKNKRLLICKDCGRSWSIINE